MRSANACVTTLLQSPLHRFLSGSTDLIRFRGRRTNREITMPTQYARHGDDVVILVGHPETKTWWRNFCSARDLSVLIQGQWTPMTACAVIGADEPTEMDPLLDAYLTRFPRARRSLSKGTPQEQAARAVVVRCRPL